MSQSRKRRGRQTELLLAAHFRANGFPHARAVNSGASGSDLEETPGLAVEVKARANLNLKAALAQAAKNADGHSLPIVITRLNGQGPETIGDWPVILRLADFLDLWWDE